MLPQQAATAGASEAAAFVTKFNDIILFPTIALLSAVAFLVFLWGVAQYFINATNEQSRQQGVQHITYGIIGLVVMLSAYTILAIATATFGLDDQLRCADNPNASGCSTVFKLPGGGSTGSDSDSDGGSTGSGSGSNGGSTGSN